MSECVCVCVCVCGWVGERMVQQAVGHVESVQALILAKASAEFQNNVGSVCVCVCVCVCVRP